jgi:hypothetical protein
MRNGSRTSLTIALSLGFVAMTLGESALAAGQRDATRGGKHPIVRIDPSPTPAPPLGTRPPASVSASAAVIRLLFTLRF